MKNEKLNLENKFDLRLKKKNLKNLSLDSLVIPKSMTRDVVGASQNSILTSTYIDKDRP